jgi:hypothetical protein
MSLHKYCLPYNRSTRVCRKVINLEASHSWFDKLTTNGPNNCPFNFEVMFGFLKMADYKQKPLSGARLT